MELEILRYRGKPDASLGLFFEVTDTRELWCFTLEDEAREEKVQGETRIPAGRYRILLRTEGGMTQLYAARFPEIHRGMLWLQDVPGFEWVYFHIGNDEGDTSGCILVGEIREEQRMEVYRSASAYVKVYERIADAIERNEAVWVTIEDYDRPRWMA